MVSNIQWQLVCVSQSFASYDQIAIRCYVAEMSFTFNPSKMGIQGIIKFSENYY